jgi:hypothetical protein
MDEGTSAQLEELLQPIANLEALSTRDTKTDRLSQLGYRFKQLALGLSDDDLNKLKEKIGQRNIPEIEGPNDSGETSK